MDVTLAFRVRYRRELRPLMQMLLHKLSDSPEDEWLRSVRETEHRVLTSPGEYLTGTPEGEFPLP